MTRLTTAFKKRMQWAGITQSEQEK
jgi:hypothetical protein